MDRSDTPTLLLPLLALLAIAFPFAMLRTPAPSGGNNPQTEQAAEQAANKESEEPSNVPQPHSAAKLIEDFLHAPKDREIWPENDPRRNYSLDFMIAIVADPIDSRLVRMFDSSIDSIQRAFEVSDYELDRFDLAWSKAARAKTDKKSGSADEAESEPPRYRREPSLLLFRNPGKKRLFLVFLVGETPTSGIHKAAMASALLQLANFYAWGPRPNRLSKELSSQARQDSEKLLTIKIMGPTFSGSAPSLEFALRDWLAGLPQDVRERVKLRIVSGSATAIDPKEFCRLHAGGRHTFQAVVPPDKIAMPTIRAYIHGLGRGLGYSRIAMLTEASTAYGQASMSQEETPQNENGQVKEENDAACTQESSENKKKSNECEPGEEPEVIYLPFPMHISELRSASANQRQSQQNAASEVMINPGGSLPLNEGQSSQPREIPPSFSTLGAPSSELVLSSLLSTISHEGIHAVGILATDVRDVLFLAREVHQHCPGTLVFTVSSDLLYSHPDESTSTRGMLVFTPYPLFNLNQVWTPPFPGQGTRVQFPSQDAEGAYNATLALLGRNDLMLDYGEPFQLEDLTPNQQERKPALWVTVVGRHGPLPIQTLCWTDTENYTVKIQRKPPKVQSADKKAGAPSSADKESHKPPTLDEEGIYSGNSALGIVLLSVVLIGLSWLIISFYHKSEGLEGDARPGWAFTLFGEPATRAYRRQARLFLLAGLACLLSFYLVVVSAYTLPALASFRLGTMPPFNPWHWGTLFLMVTTPTAAASLAVPPLTHWHWWMVFGLVAIPIAASLLSLAHAVVVVFRGFRIAPCQKSFLPVAVKRVVIGGCLIVFGLSCRLALVWLSSAWTRPQKGISTYFRAFQFFSGLSPLVPLFCLALAGFLWALCSFRRLRMIDGLRLASGGTNGEVSVLAVKTDSFDGLEALETKVWGRLEGASAFSSVWYCVLVAIGLVTAMYLFFCPFAPSYEHIGFYFLFGWGFFLVYAALTTEFGRLCLAWGAFRRVLQRVALHPIQAAFGRYHKSFPGLPRIDLSMPGQTLSVLEFSIDQAERLLRVASSLVSSRNLNGNQRQNLKDWTLQAKDLIQQAAGNLSRALNSDADGRWRSAIEERSRCQQALGKLAQMTAKLLEPSWRPAQNAPPHPEEPLEWQEFRELGEEFLAGRTVLLISYVLPSLRKLGTFILTGLLLMLFSVMFYPFVQKNHFLAFNWIVILAFVGLALLVMLQMERDVVLSLLNGTKPGQVKVTRQFTFRILTYVMVPIILLLGAQFPDTIGQVVSWFSAFQGH